MYIIEYFGASFCFHLQMLQNLKDAYALQIVRYSATRTVMQVAVTFMSFSM